MLIHIFQFKSTSKLLDVFPAPDGLVKSQVPNFVMILDKTIFHPQGGGQPNDEGFIRHVDGDYRFKLNSLTIKDDVIWHVGVFEPEEAKEHFTTGSNVECNVDEVKRRLYARVHSAGHLLDIAMT